VRIDEDFDADPRMIPSAIRCPFDNIASLANRLCNHFVIIYCQKGLKISQGAAAILRNMNINASVLEGGHFAWRDAGCSMISTKMFKPKKFFEPTRWVTCSRPEIDLVASSWLIRRFIDPGAEFLFVSHSQIKAVAERFNAVPFGADDVQQGCRDNLSTFDAFLDEFELDIPALKIMVQIIHGAQTGNHGLAPQVPGFLAISLGLPRVFRKDEKQIEAGMVLYDALYRWARDAQEVLHNSPEGLTLIETGLNGNG